MGKQAKPKRASPSAAAAAAEASFGKGKVTPVQVAFMVDRYLCDNNFTETRSVFRTEASGLISKTNLQEAPKSLLSLGAILDEYITLKEQRVIVEQEKRRVEMLLQGMQDVMQVYNSGGAIASTPSNAGSMPMTVAAAAPPALVPQTGLNVGSAAGYPMRKTVVPNSVPRPPTITAEANKFANPSANVPSLSKRRGSRIYADAPPTAKRARNQKPINLSPLQGNNNVSTHAVKHVSVTQSSPGASHHTGSSVQGSSVAKNLLKQFSSCPKFSSPGPKTPPPVDAQSDSSASPNGTKNNTPQELTPTNCAVISSSETLIISPSKQLAYYSVERNHYISTSSPIKTQLKRTGSRDHAKGRLDFDANEASKSSDEPTLRNDPSTSTSSGEIDSFDLDIDSLDIFGPDFCLSELLGDFDLDQSCLVSDPANAIAGSPPESENLTLQGNETTAEPLLTTTETLHEKDVNAQADPDALASMKSIKKCVMILSPAKNQRISPSHQGNQLT
ncbi:hypothetical protein Scep_016043 [Stephania cephalantha]|uniref:LisH domain-containing protein n=1 Tax=Stephania cephalantha TaxID=152367 RepID=A0AAP0IME8_9MAGN